MSSFFAWFLFVSIHGYEKQSRIRVSTPSHNGITMLHNEESVSTNTNEWKVAFTTQQSYDLLLQLNKEWSFDPNTECNITLTFNGTNYNSNEGDILLVVTVSNTQYFGVVIRNEISTQLYKVYPKPFESLSQRLSVESSIISPSSPDRFHRIINGSNWFNTDPTYKNAINEQLHWPLKLSIANDPTQNTVRFSQIDFASNQELYSVTYLSSFYPNNDMNIYIMSDGITESFGIYDILIDYQMQNIPTHNPTYNPTLEPTFLPTLEPTTEYPTFIPTNEPTMEPTKVPTTLHPTKSPIFPTRIYEIEITENEDIQTTDYNIIEQNGTEIEGFINARDDVQSIYSVLTHDSIAFIVTGVLVSICCMFSLLLLFCCFQSQKYEHRMLTKHEPKIEKHSEANVPSNTNNQISSMNDSRTLQHIPISNINDITGFEYTFSADGMEISETCSASTTASEIDESKAEQKEGELITNATEIDEAPPTSVPLSFIQKYVKTAENRSDLHLEMIDCPIDYGRMSVYLSDEMSTSSEERNL